jgi:hypothetical protein
MFGEIPPRQTIGERVRKWGEIGWYMLTGFFVSPWSELLVRRRILGLTAGAVRILAGTAMLWGMSGFKKPAGTFVGSKRSHALWIAVNATVIVTACATFFNNLAPFASALGLYCASAVLLNHSFSYRRIVKSGDLNGSNPQARLNHG